MSISFQNAKRSDIAELQRDLNDLKLEKRKEALYKVIALMTEGKDVSSLFPHVLKCVESQNQEMKKLVYLYFINYAKSQPELAIMGVNTFRKDSKENLNPLMRGLAVRTMGCIGVDKIADYLCDPLRDALNDEDPYVRKTAALCVAKIFEVNPEKVEMYNFIKKLQDMLSDGNGMVVSNAVAALMDMEQQKGELITMNNSTLHKLLNALPECSEWGRIYILDCLATHMPKDFKEIDDAITRVVPHLSHQNAAVTLSATKVIIRFLDFLSDPEKIRSICRKMAPPLISLMNSDPEVQYIALRNINLIIQKRPSILEKEIRVFFCNYNDPFYVKKEKLEVIIKLVDIKNVDQVLVELKDYSQEVDVQFVRRSVNAIGRVAIKLERAAERCVQALLDLVRKKVSYVVQEAVSVIKDIFRKYPTQYVSVIRELCDNLKALDNADARSAMIWIIGEYGDVISNALDLLTVFADNFKEEPPKVQLAILNATIKLYLKSDGDGEDLVQQVLKNSTEDSDNPDLRDRGYIYWRMLSNDPETAKSIILTEKPTISEDSSNLEQAQLDRLVEHIGSLATVYQKVPENFVKKIRDRINERMDLDNEFSDAEEEESKNTSASSAVSNVDFMYSEGVKKSENQEAAGNIVTFSALDDLLGTGTSTPATNQSSASNTTGGGDDLLDLLGGVSIGGSDDSPPANYVTVPFTQVLTPQEAGSMSRVTGLGIEASVQRYNSNIVLKMKIFNGTSVDLKDIAMQMNKNPFGLNVKEQPPTSLFVARGNTVETEVKLGPNMVKDDYAPQCPYRVQAAMKTNADVFYFNIPVMMTIFLDRIDNINAEKYQKMWTDVPTRPEFYSQVNPISGQLITNESLKQRMVDNGMYFLIASKNAEGKDAQYFVGKTTNEIPIMCEIIQGMGTANIQVKSSALQIVPLFQQMIMFLLSANI